MAFSESTTRHLDELARVKQSTCRVPGLMGAVARKGRLEWALGVGSADLDEPGVAPDVDTPYLIASNTKTFVAVVVMALRDEGHLSLDDTVEAHLPGAAHGGVTIREMLAHVSGMQREPVGNVWDTLEFPDRDGLIDSWNAAERVGRAHEHWHYSNLCFAVLGEIVSRIEGEGWFDVVKRRILDPLGMASTTDGPGERLAGTYFVPPWSDVAQVEPVLELGAFSPAASLASTTADLATWGGFLANPDPHILHPDTVEEMCQPLVVADLDTWETGWGLGLMLVRHGGHTWVGHTGGMPGSVTGIFTHRDSATTGICLMNASNGRDPAASAVAFGAASLEREPVPTQVWLPGTFVPDELEAVLGHWFSEGNPFTFAVRQGRLEARLDTAAATKPPSVFERIGTDVYRTTSGRERGELLRIDRDADGTVSSLHWATYLFTRGPRTFGA